MQDYYGTIMDVHIFWDRVKFMIRKNKTTQEAVARACDRPVSTFKGWIKKNYFPTVIDGYLIADYLGVTVEYLVTGKERAARKDIEDIRCLLHRAEEKLGKIPS